MDDRKRRKRTKPKRNDVFCCRCGSKIRAGWQSGEVYMCRGCRIELDRQADEDDWHAESDERYRGSR